jgi:NTF2 fold immunity protein
MKTQFLILSALILVSPLFCEGRKSKPKFVADSATAIEIAEKALFPVYGRRHIESERPFTATLNDGVWTVHGTLRCSVGKGGATTICAGGAANVEISQKNGHILRMWPPK